MSRSTASMSVERPLNTCKHYDMRVVGVHGCFGWREAWLWGNIIGRWRAVGRADRPRPYFPPSLVRQRLASPGRISEDELVGEIGRAVGALIVQEDEGGPAQTVVFIARAACSGKMGTLHPTRDGQLADEPPLGSCTERCGGSNPPSRSSMYPWDRACTVCSARLDRREERLI